MLSRSAENLFWMARNMERTENTARMLDVSFRMALLPSTIDKQALHFEPILAIAPGSGRFHELYGELTHETIIRYVALEPENCRLDLVAHPRRARERPRPALGHLQRGVGEPELDLAASAESRLRGPEALGLSRFLRLGEGALASLPWRGVRHHAA